MKFHLRKGISIIFSTICVSLALFLTHCSENKLQADLILINGKIITVDNANLITEAIAINSDTIIAVGSNDEITTFANDSTTIIDLKGKTAIPGFIDSHAHLIGTGEDQINLNLRDAQNWDEVVLMVARAAEKARNGEWIIGRGWHQEKWKTEPIKNYNGYPTHQKLSEATPHNPVMLKHASGHAIFANQNAMDLANIKRETENPRGGKIIRDEEGNAIGVFMEEAETLIAERYIEYVENRSVEEQEEDKRKTINLAMDKCLSNGVTSFHDAGASYSDIRLLRKMAEEGNLKIRLYEMLLEDYETLKDSLRVYQTVGYGNNHLTVRAIKLYMDGALGSRGAWLLSEYNDSPKQYGMNVTRPSDITKIAQLAADNDFQICTHAIGDKANRVTLDIYEEAFKNFSNKSDLRWRIEHAQHLTVKDIPRFAELGVIAAMQGIHCTSDAPFVEKRLGKGRAKYGAYVWQSLLDNGAVICNGTDSPVEDINPIANFYALITRKLADGNEFYPEQKLSRIDALKTQTINGAYAAFEEDIKGSLEVGKLADITVLSKDILTEPENGILTTKINYTIVGGKILYQQP